MIRRVPVTDDPAPEAGRTYRRKLRAVHGRPTWRCLTTPRRQRLSLVTLRDAQAEGYQGRRALDRFRIDWVRNHDRNWMRLHATASDEDILTRWRTKHAGRDCWVVVLELVEAQQFLADQRVAHLHDDGQYASTPTVDPLPVMHPSRGCVERARESGAAMRAAHREADRAQAAAARAARSAQRSMLRAQRRGLAP